MKSRVTWLASTMLVLALGIGGLWGCSFAGEPNSAADLLLRFANNPNNSNCAIDARVDASVSLAGYRVRTPVTAQLKSADSCAHGTVTADLSAINAGTQTYEVYAEIHGGSVAVYVHPDASKAGTWDRSEVNATFELDIPLAVELLSDAKFMRVSYDSDEQICYELILPAKNVVETLLDMGTIETSFWEVDKGVPLDAVKESKLHVCFNKDCLVRSVSLDLNFTYENKELVPQPLKVSVDFDATMDDYGTVDPATTLVPKDVKSGSKLTDDPIYAKDNAQKLMEAAS
ncbi:MAG: hypothetical protein J6D34_05830 [Atopobiaceae bacterium]|nr:hypothetical protein [Atopobiaceae bacterium]